MKIDEFAAENPCITSAVLACATNIVLAIVKGYSDIHNMSQFGRILAAAFFLPIMMAFITFPIAILVGPLLMSAYWYSERNREYLHLRVAASVVAGLYWISMLLLSFSHRFM